jgi:hypothetical protein
MRRARSFPRKDMSHDFAQGIPAGDGGCVRACLRLRAGPLGRVAAQQKLTQADILRFDPLGTVTILHVTDIHAQLMPLYFREPAINLGVGAEKGKPPHLTDKAFRDYLQDRHRLGRCLCADLGRFARWQRTTADGRHGPRRHADQGRAGRARRRQGAAARWRRHLAGQLDALKTKAAGHGRGDGSARRSTP